MKPLLLLGCGGHARSIMDILVDNQSWSIIGLIGLPQEVGTNILGNKVLGTDIDLPYFREICSHAFLAIGQIGIDGRRIQITNKLKKLNFKTPSIISSFSRVSRYASIAPGTSVGHGVIVNAGAKVGEGCIINSQALIEHDVQISDHCHISTGAIVNGGVSIGSNSFIGSGAILREGLVLPPNTIISAGKRIMGWPVRQQ